MLELSQEAALVRVRAALDEMYGARLQRAVLFGSRARGDARPDSDYDVAVFLDPLGNGWKEHNRLAELRVQFLEDMDVFLEAFPFEVAAYAERTPLMHEIRRDGRDI